MSTGQSFEGLWCGCVTLFPDMFAALHYGVIGRAIENKRLMVTCENPRDYAEDRYRRVDDYPYGGGPGMVMMAQPLLAAIDALKQRAPVKPRVIFMSPQGKQLTQEALRGLLERQALIIISGRYDGVDQRLIDAAVDEEWSIGDVVVSGGELPAMLLIDAMTRLLPGVLGDDDSAKLDSITSGLLQYPQYTRPDQVLGESVPEVLQSGNHAAIARWRLKESLGKTQERRPDLLAKRGLSAEETRLLREYLQDPSDGKNRSS